MGSETIMKLMPNAAVYLAKLNNRNQKIIIFIIDANVYLKCENPMGGKVKDIFSKC